MQVKTNTGRNPNTGLNGESDSDVRPQSHPDERATLEQEFQTVVSQLAEDYLVGDIVLPTSTLLFILESPHVQELQFGAPVSGSSGITMTRHLFGAEYAKFALGRLVKKHADEGKDRPQLNRIGLINVSNVPLQSAAYGNPALVHAHRPWFDAMSTVRSDNQRDTNANPHCQAVQSVLVESLKLKLNQLASRPCTIVPCGRFAQKFFRLTGVHSPNWRVIMEVPHPSYNSWDRSRYSDVIHQVRQALDSGV